MDALISWAIGALGGAVGGIVAGLARRFQSVPPLVKTLGGAIGGLVGGQGLIALGALQNLGVHAGNAGNTAVSAAVGALVTVVAGLLKKPTA